MKQINCGIIQDILPLYVDDTVCTNTRELVEEHLQGCPACRQELELLRQDVTLPMEQKAEPLKQLRRAWTLVKLKVSLTTIVFTAILAALVIAGLWYTRPMTLAELCPELPLSDCLGIQVWFEVYDGPRDTGFESLELTPEDPEFALLLEQFQSRTFRRSLLSLLPQGTRYHTLQEGDFQWELHFQFQRVPLPDGSTATGGLLRFDNFYGELTLSDRRFADSDWRVTTADSDEWVAAVMEVILDVQD